jgi:hypothetical protein
MRLTSEEQEKWYGDLQKGTQAAASSATPETRAANLRQMAESLLCLTAKELDLAQEHEHEHGNGGVHRPALAVSR